MSISGVELEREMVEDVGEGNADKEMVSGEGFVGFLRESTKRCRFVGGSSDFSFSMFERSAIWMSK